MNQKESHFFSYFRPKAFYALPGLCATVLEGYGEGGVVRASESKLHIRLRFYVKFHGNYQMISSFVRIAVLIFLTILPAFLAAQPNAENLKIVVVEGEGGINNMSQHTTPLTTVRVEDESQHPVSGATVVFALPTDGQSGAFQNGAKTLAITTNEQGLA